MAQELKVEGQAVQISILPFCIRLRARHYRREQLCCEVRLAAAATMSISDLRLPCCRLLIYFSCQGGASISLDFVDEDDLIISNKLCITA